ncbi:MAG: hypothetical protein ACJ8C4_19825 [Gemmataceae bacterium]
MTPLRRCGPWLCICLFAGPLVGQVVAPPPPKEYDVELRYRIRAPRNERIRQYLDLTRDLDAAGLVREESPREDATDPNAERMRGRLPSAALERVLAEPHVQTVLLTPADWKLPEGDARVPVRIELTRGLAPVRQRLLAQQTRERLARLGFIEKVGYDHRDATLLVGTMPANMVPLLLGDLRLQPGGWLSPIDSPDALPEPIRSVSPLRVIRVEPQPEGLPLVADAIPPVLAATDVKVSPDLIALLNSDNGAATHTRLDVVLLDAPNTANPQWGARLRSAANLTIEGVAGQIVTVVSTAGAARELAALPEVASVRLPVAASPPVGTSDGINPGNVLVTTNLSRLHKSGTGRGIKLVIIDGDFAGLNRYLNRSLPHQTKFIDLTAERNVTLQPDPLPDDRAGRGTLAALAAALAAPLAEIVLIRVDPAAPYQVISIAHAVAGLPGRSEALRLRHEELLQSDVQLRDARARLNEERRVDSENFDASEEAQKRRVDLQNRLRDQERKESEYEQLIARFTNLEQDLFNLRYASVVANNLNWLDGLPADGTGAVAAFLDGPAQLGTRPAKVGAATWLQSAGDTQGQAWAGPLWDVDGNGVLEFAPPVMPLPVNRWTRELNFLGWQPHEGGPASQIPAGARLRLAVQWTEAQDPLAPVDLTRWRTPLTNLQPVLLRQRDPSGQKLSSDDMIVLARSATLPQMLARGRGWASFEQVIEFTTDVAGTYAVRLEGKLAVSTTPPEVATIPAALRHGEVYPRVTVSVLDDKSRDAGRPVFADFRTGLGGIGSPGDARAAVVIGAGNNAGRLQPYSAIGSSPSLSLVTRPTLIVPDEFVFGGITSRGSAQANGFMAGVVAAMLSAGAPPSADLGWLQLRPGGAFVVPEAWLNQLKQ